MCWSLVVFALAQLNMLPMFANAFCKWLRLMVNPCSMWLEFANTFGKRFKSMYLIPCGVDSKSWQMRFATCWESRLNRWFASLVNCANVVCKLSWSGVQFVALILKVCKCVLQLVENLAFMPWVHLESTCKCVLQFELLFQIILVLSELSVVPAVLRGTTVCGSTSVVLRNYRVR